GPAICFGSGGARRCCPCGNYNMIFGRSQAVICARIKPRSGAIVHSQDAAELAHHTMIKICRGAFALLLLAVAGAQAFAEDEAAAQIRAALMRWTEAFNARDTGAVCDLFARDLRYDFRGARERGYDDICALLGRSLTDPGARYTYSPAIKEILVAGDLA